MTNRDSNYKIKAGDVLQSTWGYDQTNVDFFFVLKRTEKTATVVQIQADRRAGENYDTYTATPRVPMVPVGKPFRRKVQDSGYYGESLRRASYAYLYAYRGEAVHGSSYA